MRDPQFRQQQEDGIRAPHVAPINALVDELTDRCGLGRVPYVAPVYGGVGARALCLLQSPGRMTDGQHGGSGFLSPENDDAGAELFATQLDEAGISARSILAWNAYPWYTGRRPSAAELDAGVEPLRQLLGLLPRLQVVLLLGGSARDSWKRLARHPGAAPRLKVVPTHLTSSRAFIGSPEVRAARMADLRAAFARTARILQESG